jgi:hypothetical protein
MDQTREWTVERHLLGRSPEVVAFYERYLDLQRTVTDPRIHRVAPYTKKLFIHYLWITSPDQLDDEFHGWLKEAYAVGQGAHLNRPPPAAGI